MDHFSLLRKVMAVFRVPWQGLIYLCSDISLAPIRIALRMSQSACCQSCNTSSLASSWAVNSPPPSLPCSGSEKNSYRREKGECPKSGNSRDRCVTEWITSSYLEILWIKIPQVPRIDEHSKFYGFVFFFFHNPNTLQLNRHQNHNVLVKWIVVVV